MHMSISSHEYDAVRHILEAPGIAERTAPYVSSSDFDFAGLHEEAKTMSGGEALLVRIAHELWLAEKAAGLWELTRRLDEANFRRVLEALSRCRGWMTAGRPAFELVA
jgi:energy-coupling factor transporter ATP-binding protein EcfA2